MRALVLGLLCLVSSCALFGVLHAKGGLAVDDGFIVLRYATHLLAGQGPVYNPGEHVEGFSSPLWVAVLAGLEALVRMVAAPDPGRLELLNRGLGVVCAAGAVVATFVFARRCLVMPLAYALGAAFAVQLSWPVIFWSGAGLEAPLFALLLLLAATRLADPERFVGRRAATTALLLTALGVCRPEGPLFVALSGMVSWKISAAAEKRRATIVLSSVLAIHLAFVAVRFAYYGEVFPNTYYAKVGGGTRVLLRGAFYLYDYLGRGGGLGLGILAVLGVWSLPIRSALRGEHAGRETIRRHLPVLVLLATGVAFILLVGGDGLYCFRFIVHLVPLLATYAALGAHAVEQRLRPLNERAAPWLAKAALTFALYLGVQPFIDGERLLRGVRNEMILESESDWIELGRSLREVMPSNAVLATNVAGKVPYESQLRTIDMLGLTDKVIAKTKVKSMGEGYAGHEKANVGYVVAQRPDVIFISVLERLPLEAIRSGRRCQQVLSSTVLRAYGPLLAAESFARDYVPAQILGHEGAATPVFLRRDLAEKLPATPRVRVLTWREEAGAAATPSAP